MHTSTLILQSEIPVPVIPQTLSWIPLFMIGKHINIFHFWNPVSVIVLLVSGIVFLSRLALLLPLGPLRLVLRAICLIPPLNSTPTGQLPPITTLFIPRTMFLNIDLDLVRLERQSMMRHYTSLQDYTLF